MISTEEVDPVREKDLYVRGMFNNISRKYDFLNHFLSAGTDRYWRKKAIRLSGLTAGDLFLDVACGTGDLSIEATRRHPSKIIAVDFAENMLQHFQSKRSSSLRNDGLQIVQANAEVLPFPDAVFDVVGAAFGVRNFGDLKKGLSEMRRVLKSGGRIVVLEFSKPRRFPIKQVYFFYFKRILPFLGKVISGNGGAYNYLPSSVSAFPDGEDFEDMMQSLNFTGVKAVPLTFGIATAYLGRK